MADRLFWRAMLREAARNEEGKAYAGRIRDDELAELNREAREHGGRIDVLSWDGRGWLTIQFTEKR